jgi:hypothetical protein
MSSSYASDTSLQALPSSPVIRSASSKRWKKFLFVAACPVADVMILLNLLQECSQVS